MEYKDGFCYVDEETNETFLCFEGAFWTTKTEITLAHRGKTRLATAGEARKYWWKCQIETCDLTDIAKRINRAKLLKCLIWVWSANPTNAVLLYSQSLRVLKILAYYKTIQDKLKKGKQYE